jgi:hypothetical protein
VSSIKEVVEEIKDTTSSQPLKADSKSREEEKSKMKKQQPPKQQ